MIPCELTEKGQRLAQSGKWQRGNRTRKQWLNVPYVSSTAWGPLCACYGLKHVASGGLLQSAAVPDCGYRLVRWALWRADTHVRGAAAVPDPGQLRGAGDRGGG